MLNGLQDRILAVARFGHNPDVWNALQVGFDQLPGNQLIVSNERG